MLLLFWRLIAVIVIAAINPIEQANRARDTKFSADSGQIVSALERYDAVHSEFPWVTSGSFASNEDSFGFISAASSDVGLCGDAKCSTDGALITSGELKAEFRNRDFVKSTAADKTIMVGKLSGSTQSIYACYIPLSISSRQKDLCRRKSVYFGSKWNKSECK